MADPFIWYELMTPDAEAAAAFYKAVVGWTPEPRPGPGFTYTVLMLGDRGVGGIMPMPDHVRNGGGRPGWLGYIGVGDADAATDAVKAAGGTVHRPPADIPEVGRFSVVSDPGGAVFQILAPLPVEAPPPLPPGTAGTIGWHELYAADGKDAFDFYAGLFGWSKAGEHDMGPTMGIYQLFATGGEPAGGMMTNFDAKSPPRWNFYFNVDAIEAGAARATEAGAQIVMGPHQVPGGKWIVQCVDPQGAGFALLADVR